jgi:NAD(P)-dependent dehydrogenase (short-subunit alcohol dehydrogenase family)
MLPSMRLDDKVVMVTGSGSGIGRAVAIASAESGADCVVCELPNKVDDLNAVCEEVRALGKRALPVLLQLPNLASIDAAVSEAINAFGCDRGRLGWCGGCEFEGPLFYVATGGP